MAQHIGLVEIDEFNQTLRTSDANFAPVQKMLTELIDYKISYPWLSSIDEYGNTVFNHLQIPYLMRELTGLGNKINKQDAVKELERILNFLGNVNGYVKFIGD